jgi:predicted RNA-binding protein Jag
MLKCRIQEAIEKLDLLINANDYREKQTSRLQYIASEATKK